MPTALINQVNLYYEIHGDGPRMLFLHGLGSSVRDWAPQIDTLQAKYRCIAYDARGHGRSDKPPGPYHVRQHAADAIGLLDHLGIPAAIVVGLSMGGMIAFQMAVDAPERFLGMVIINSGPHLVPSNMRERMAIWQRVVLFRLFSMQRIGELICQRLFPDESQAELRATFVQRWAENDKRAYMDATRGLVGWSVREHVASIQIPALVIAADQDYTPVEAKRAYVTQMPHAELVVVENARHAVNVVQPEKINALIDQFAARVAQPAEQVRA